MPLSLGRDIGRIVESEAVVAALKVASFLFGFTISRIELA
jgi:hypothetical protein